MQRHQLNKQICEPWKVCTVVIAEIQSEVISFIL